MRAYHATIRRYCIEGPRSPCLARQWLIDTALGEARSSHRLFSGYGSRAAVSFDPSSPSVNPGKPPEDIGILGGGITGLSAAYYALKAHAERFPDAPPPKITIYEGSERLGGWIQSKKVSVPGGEVRFDQGPKTVRLGSIAGLHTLELIQDLGLSFTSIMAAKRWIYTKKGLKSIPPPIIEAITDLFDRNSVWRGAFFGAIKEFFLGRPRPREIKDQSLGAVLERRFNKSVPDDLASAMIHGIYAGDIWKLSARSIFPGLWEIDGRVQSVAHAGRQKVLDRDVEYFQKLRPGTIELYQRVIAGTVGQHVQGGLAELMKTLESALRFTFGAVEIKTQTRVTGLKMEGTDSIDVYSESQSAIGGKESQVKSHSQIICTLPTYALAKIVNDESLNNTPSVNVAVVNLLFADPLLLRKRNVQGFGYLVPASAGPERNRNATLGVIFDSDVINDFPPELSADFFLKIAKQTQGVELPKAGNGVVNGTRLTVMLGGHMWGMEDDPNAKQEDEGEDKSSRGDAVQLRMLREHALGTLRDHLGINDNPVAENVVLQKKCIPQYTVGHRERMKRMHHKLASLFKGRLSVAGSFYSGVAVPDCVLAARRVADAVVEGRYLTGLENYLSDEVWVENPMPEGRDPQVITQVKPASGDPFKR